MTDAPAKYQRAQWPADAAERITVLLEIGATWVQIAEELGANYSQVRYYAQRLGIFALKNRYFTAVEDAIIRADYLANVDFNETAQKLGRRKNDIHQRIRRNHHDLIHTTRTGRGTRALKRYGADLLRHGATASEALDAIHQKLIDAKGAARVAALAAKTKRRTEILDTMQAQIAAGKDRNDAIFEARACGALLQSIADRFDLTKERVRQICDAVAFRRVTTIQSREAAE